MNYRENLQTLKTFWDTKVDPDSVDLMYYACNSVACLGGHVALAGLFGVEREGTGGTPMLEQKRYCLYGNEVADHLFGDTNLFNRRGNHPADKHCPRDATDYQVACNRITYALEAK